MKYAFTRSQILALTVLFVRLVAPTPSQAAPITLEFFGHVFAVLGDDVYLSSPGNSSSFFLTYDPALLTGNDMGDTTFYQTAPGQTSITCSFITSGGDSFTCDNNFAIRIGVRNTTPAEGDDRFTVDAEFGPTLTMSLILLETPGTNPFSSNALPTGAFGGGPGTWMVSELFVDRTDVFARISTSASTITQVGVPEPSTLSLLLCVSLAVWAIRRRAKASTALKQS